MKPDFEAMNYNRLTRLEAAAKRLEYENTRLRDQVIALLDAIDYFGLAHRSACAIALYPPSPCDCGMDVVIAELESKGFLDKPSRIP